MSARLVVSTGSDLTVAGPHRTGVVLQTTTYDTAGRRRLRTRNGVNLHPSRWPGRLCTRCQPAAEHTECQSRLRDCAAPAGHRRYEKTWAGLQGREIP